MRQPYACILLLRYMKSDNTSVRPSCCPIVHALQKRNGTFPLSRPVVSAAVPVQRKRGRREGPRQPTEAQAAGLRWCAQQLAHTHVGAGDSEQEALAFLEARGVRCASNSRNGSRLFRFPGCLKPVSKEHLATALGLQVCACAICVTHSDVLRTGIAVEAACQASKITKHCHIIVSNCMMMVESLCVCLHAYRVGCCSYGTRMEWMG
jgi:hypothetical protein